jgi:hypothetical protein
MTKGQAMAREMSRFLNSAGDSDYISFVKHMIEQEHPIIQQELTKVLTHWIPVMSKQNPEDSRITASVVLTTEILEKVDKDKLTIT